MISFLRYVGRSVGVEIPGEMYHCYVDIDRYSLGVRQCTALEVTGESEVNRSPER